MGYKTDPLHTLERRLESWRKCLRTGRPRSEVRSAPRIIRELEAEIERRKTEFTGGQSTMKKWLKSQDWYWRLYYEHEIQWEWLPTPKPRTWHVILLPGMEAPVERPGWKQQITRLDHWQVTRRRFDVFGV